MEEVNRVSQAENIIIQLGISALVVLVLGYVGYKVAVLLINKWAHGDSQRTTAIQDGFRVLADSHTSVLRQVNENHQHVLGVINAHQADEVETINQFRLELTALDTKVSTAMDLTPVRPPRIGEPKSRASTDSPTPIPRPIGEYGPSGRKKG